ncbi:MAG TPA: hypothetical protein VJ506_01100 [Candidatus Limnocylindrales bacterium]|nr:hypothetical protein [Candidatus Limnocylindrales bacterium]
MAELDRFDSQLTAAVQAFADAARTEVDAVAVATRAARGRRTGAQGWLGQTVPVPVALLLLLGLLLLLAASLAVGGWLPFRAPALVAAPSPSAPVPTADALGRVHVTGTESVVLQTGSSSTVVGDVTQLRGGIVSVTTTANDPRASGTGTFAFSVDVTGDAGVEWGTYHLETAGGTWDGSCSGSTWSGGDAAVGTCWLTGGGAFAGFTYFRGYSWIPGRVWVEGAIYPGPPPEP